MIKLPKGYYAVQSDFENASKNVFVFKGVEYEVTEGENLFANVIDAHAAAVEIPETVLEGLDYESFETPVLVFSSGIHRIAGFKPDRDITLLGEMAGVDPNVKSADPLEAPVLNSLRAPENESVLYGGSHFAHMILNVGTVKKIVYDGFIHRRCCFRDLSNDGCDDRYLIFKNIIVEGPTGKSTFLAGTPKAGGILHRHVFFENVRLDGFHDADCGSLFAQVSANEVVIDNICFNNCNALFGFTILGHRLNSAACTSEVSEYVIKNSYFGNFKCEMGISTGCRDTEDRGAVLKISDSVFVNASLENEAPLQPHLANDLCALYVDNCTFVDTRGNSNTVVSIYGEGRRAELTNCKVDGFAGEISAVEMPTKNAPDHIENRDEAWVTDAADPHKVSALKDADFTALDARYEGTKAYYGDLHVHTSCGGRSDGKTPMSEWPAKMDENGIDFAVVVDHRQMRGFFLPEWDDEKFIIGTEPGTTIVEGLNTTMGYNSIHYLMLFPHKYGLAMVLANFPEFEFKGDELTGIFNYPKFTKERFMELTRYIQSIGGILVHPHPKDLLYSMDPIDFYFGEHTYIETLVLAYPTHPTFRSYRLWTDLLAMGKRVYASGGSDTHGAVSSMPFGVFYTKEKSGRTFFDQMHSADFAVGGIGMKMCIDGNPMGSEIEYKDGMKLTLRVDDIFPKVLKDETAYELRIITDKGLAYSSIYNGKLPQAVELEVEKRAFYRAEIFDLTHEHFVAIGNPIWLD